MRVRVKEGKTGFIYGIQRTEGTEFNLKPVAHSIEKDDNNKPKIITVEQQFSKIWMDKVGDTSSPEKAVEEVVEEEAEEPTEKKQKKTTKKK